MIYLVGGASRSGKSVLARRLAGLLGISALSTDYLVQAFKSGVPAMEFDTDQSDDNRAHKMESFLSELIARTTHSGQSLVIEGVHLLPEMVSKICDTNPQVRVCFLGFANSTPQQELTRVRNHPKYPGDWLAECTDAEAIPYLESSITRSQLDATVCQKLGLQYVDVAADFTAAQNTAIAFLAGETRPNVRLGVAAHVCRNGKVLAFQRIGEHGQGTWTVLGGHLENGETWEDCAIRETQEEGGIAAHSPQLFAVTNDVFPDTGKHYVTLHIALKADTDSFTNAEPEKHQHLGWYAWDAIPEPRFPCIQSVYNQNVKPPYLSANAVATQWAVAS